MRKVVFIHAAGRLAEGSGPLVAYLEDELGAGFEVTAPGNAEPDLIATRTFGSRVIYERLRARPRMSRSDTQAPD